LNEYGAQTIQCITKTDKKEQLINTVPEIDKKDIYTKKKVDAKKQSKQGDSHAIDYYSKYTKFPEQESATLRE
jgi:hypothetical protein